MDDKPVNVWFHDGMEYTDYRLPGGCIVTIQTPHPRISVDEVMTALGLTDEDLPTFAAEPQESNE